MQRTDSPGNQLIDSLPRRDRAALLAACEPTEFAFAQVLAEPGERMRHAYFPTTGFISLIASADANARLEVGLVGAEGM
ncbi:MAG: Crp/Fnr family transcriptional regulator, partial [Burkholderiaceae bacterium]